MNISFNEITNLLPDIVFDHCVSIVFLLFIVHHLSNLSVMQFKLITDQNNLQF